MLRVFSSRSAEFPALYRTSASATTRTIWHPPRRRRLRSSVLDLSEGNLAHGFSIPRGSSMRSEFGRNDTSSKNSELEHGESLQCQFRTAHDLSLWPIELVAAEYFSYAPDLPLNTLRVGQKVRGGVRLRLRATAGLSFSESRWTACLCISGSEESPISDERVLGACIGVLLVPPTRPNSCPSSSARKPRALRWIR